MFRRIRVETARLSPPLPGSPLPDRRQGRRNRLPVRLIRVELSGDDDGHDERCPGWRVARVVHDKPNASPCAMSDAPTFTLPLPRWPAPSSACDKLGGFVRNFHSMLLPAKQALKWAEFRSRKSSRPKSLARTSRMSAELSGILATVTQKSR